MEKGAGYYYQVRMRLKGQLSRHHWTLGKPFTKNQEDAWDLLNEFERVIATLGKVERFLPQDERYELTYSVRHTLLLHRPACKTGIGHAQPDERSESGSIPNP